MKRERIVPIIPLTITSHRSSKNKFTVPKADLVENLLNLISAGRLKIAEDIPNRDLLFEELRGYRSRQSPQGRTVSYSPAGSGHDDLLDALMLSCYAGDKNWTPLFQRAAPGLYGTVDRRPISRSRWELEGNLSRSLYAQHNSDYADLRGWVS